MRQYTDGKRTISASSINEAVEILFPNTYYKNPNGRGSLATVYTYRRLDHWDIEVYKLGDKQGKEWGDNAAKPQFYQVRRCG